MNAYFLGQDLSKSYQAGLRKPCIHMWLLRGLTDKCLSVCLCRCSDEDASSCYDQIGYQPPSLRAKHQRT